MICFSEWIVQEASHLKITLLMDFFVTFSQEVTYTKSPVIVWFFRCEGSCTRFFPILVVFRAWLYVYENVTSGTSHRKHQIFITQMDGHSIISLLCTRYQKGWTLLPANPSQRLRQRMVLDHLVPFLSVFSTSIKKLCSSLHNKTMKTDTFFPALGKTEQSTSCGVKGAS